jgi:hypothetical protein
VQRALRVRGRWDTIAPRAPPPHGLIEHTDVAPPQPGAFYRVRLGP